MNSYMYITYFITIATAIIPFIIWVVIIQNSSIYFSVVISLIIIIIIIVMIPMSLLLAVSKL